MTKRKFSAPADRSQKLGSPRGFRGQSYGAAGPCVSLIAPPTAKRIVITGGRKYSDQTTVFQALDAVLAKHGTIQLAQGGAPGADALAREWARIHAIPCMTFRADWDALGPKAGPVRNQKMIDEFKPDGLIAFPGNAGTEDCVRCAVRAGIPVWQPAKTNPRRSHQEEARQTA